MLNRFKTGDCSCGCEGVGVHGRKVGKIFYCISSYSMMKRKQYSQKTNLNNKIRVLGNKQVQTGDYEGASIQALKNDLDFVFSRIVRLTAADEHGNCACYTCGKVKHWSLQQCGHFIKRGEMATRWDFRNVRVQDKFCNENLDGNLKVFEQKMNEEYPGLADQLREISKEPYKWYVSELKRLLIDLRIKYDILQNT